MKNKLCFLILILLICFSNVTIVNAQTKELKITKLFDKNIEDKEEWFKWYKEYFEGKQDPPETIYDYFSEEEIDLICRVVESEASGQSFDSKCNIASVIFNRLENEKFSDDVTEVITQPSQFVYNKTNYDESTILAVEYAFCIEDTTNGALFFNVGTINSWANNNKIYLFTDEAGHSFYK